jgi:hypothetical protein
MPACTRRSVGPLLGAAQRLFRASAAIALLLAACKSTPCVGDACPNACNGVDCEADVPADAAPEPPPPDPRTPGRFIPCTSDASCDEASGFACVEGTCRHPCRSHFDCGGVGLCEPLGRGGTYCALTDPPTLPGGFYSNCANGDCDDTRGFVCVGAGIADTESYCSTDCEGDGDCPTGFYCDVIQNSAGQNRDLCVPRGFCAECQSDTDCLAIPGGVCAVDGGGERRCTALCDPGRNSCPWGAATECRVTDERLGVPTCQHRFGSCRGEGLGCHPCLRDDDCPAGYCITSLYSGERWCVDQTLPCSCEGLPTGQDFCAGAANGCPASPSRLQMVCYDPSPAGEGLCIGVNRPGATVGSDQLSCWR